MSRRSNTDIIYGDFEWNADKAQYNLKEHGVAFEEASNVFNDPFYIIFKDPDHSVGEQRYYHRKIRAASVFTGIFHGT